MCRSGQPSTYQSRLSCRAESGLLKPVGFNSTFEAIRTRGIRGSLPSSVPSCAEPLGLKTSADCYTIDGLSMGTFFRSNRSRDSEASYCHFSRVTECEILASTLQAFNSMWRVRNSS